MNHLPVPIDFSHCTFGYNYFSSAIKPSILQPKIF